MAQKKKAAPKKAAKKAAPKKAAKKAAPKKAAKKAAPKKAAPSKASAGPIKDKLTKSQILASLSESTGLTKAQVGSVMDGIEQLVARSVSKKGAGEFTVPGLMKIVTINKPAVKARKGINPFTGEPTTFKAKPASIAVKIRPLKKLKEFAK